MKKKILIICVVTILALAALGGSVFAATGHTYASGQKLVGLGPLGTISVGNPAIPNQHSTNFNFSNPNCDKSIIITQISILKADGSVAYQGPYFDVTTITQPSGPPQFQRTVNINPMLPHETRSINLQFCMPTSQLITSDPAIIGTQSNWLNPGNALTQPNSQYTVEVFWKPSGSFLVNPLVGFSGHSITRFKTDGSELSYSFAQLDMVNMMQINQNKQ
jgi:hypothetical protein